MLGRRIDAPLVVIVICGDNVVGELHGGAAGLVQFVDVMGLGQRELVAVFLCKFCQLLVEHKYDVHSNAEVGRSKEALTLGQATLLDFLKMVLPSRSADDNRNMQVEAAVNVADHLVGLAEVDGDIGLLQLLNALFPFLGIVDGDDDFMLMGEGGFLHFVAHLSVSDYGDFHCVYF